VGVSTKVIPAAVIMVAIGVALPPTSAPSIKPE